MQSHGLQFVVLQVRQQFLRTEMCAIKLVVGIFDMVIFMQRLQATLVKRNAMRHHGQILHFVGHIVPHRWKRIGIRRVLIPDSVHFRGPEIVSVGHRLNQTVKTVNDFIIAHDDHTHATGARHLAVGRLKVNSGEVMEMVLGDIARPLGIGPVGTFNLFLICVQKHFGGKITEISLRVRKNMLPLPRKVEFTPPLFND